MNTMNKLVKSLFLATCVSVLFHVSTQTTFAACSTVKEDFPTWGTLQFCDYNNNGSGEDSPPNEFSFLSCSSAQVNSGTLGEHCCNTVGECAVILNPTVTLPPVPTPLPSTTPTTGPNINPLDPPTDAFFDLVDPLQHGGGQTILDDTASPYANDLKTPGGIVSRALTFAFPLAGLILFVMLVWAGFEILIGAPTKKSIDAGKQRATAALVGFLLLFAAYWIFQIVEVVFGVRIL